MRANSRPRTISIEHDVVTYFNAAENRNGTSIDSKSDPATKIDAHRAIRQRLSAKILSAKSSK
jgi:hypothetical protein